MRRRAPAGSRPPRRVAVALAGLYLAQTVPLYLVAAALPPILRERGVDLATIGTLGVLLAPWVLKAAWAPAVDRLSRRRRVGRKGVVLACLGLTVAGLAVLSALDPVADAGRFFPVLMTMSLASATQDIAADGWAIEHLEPGEQPAGNALQAGATAGGVILGGSGTLLLIGPLGWSATLLAVAGVAVVSVLPFLWLPEGAHARALPEEPGRVRPGLRRFLGLPGAGAMLLFAVIFRLPEGLVKALEQPFLVDQGLSLAEVGLISGGAAAAVGLLGAGAGAAAIGRLGLGPFLVALVVGRTLVFGAFFAAAGFGIGTAALVALSAVDTFLRYVEIVGLSTAFMRFASLAQPGTDFTALSSVTLAMYMIGSLVAGHAAHSFGYAPVFGAALVLSALTGWLAVRCLPAHVARPPSPRHPRSSQETPA